MRTADEIDVLEMKLRAADGENRRLRETLRDGYYRAALTGLLAYGYSPAAQVVSKAWEIADLSITHRNPPA